MLTCDASLGLARIPYGKPLTHFHAGQAFPQQWTQLGANQSHNTVFPGAARHTAHFWASPLTGMEYQHLRAAKQTFDRSASQTWEDTLPHSLTNVTGVSIAQGIIFAQLGSHEIFALDATTGHIIWQQALVNTAGMSQAVVGPIDGQLIVFVPVGDANFNLTNTIDFANGQPHSRGAQFAGVFAFNAITGTPLWEFPTKGAARPTPILQNNKLYLSTSGGQFYVLDAATGTALGSLENPNGGYPGSAAMNWYKSTTGELYIIYGTLRPRNIIAINATDPSNPSLAWIYTATEAVAESTGDTPVAIDQQRGLVISSILTSTAVAGTYDLNVIALNAENGAPVWNHLSGTGPKLASIQSGVPVLHQDTIFVANALSQHLLAYQLDTGQLRWATNVTDNQDLTGAEHRPSGAGAYFEGKYIHAQGNMIRTLDASTGQVLNTFRTSADNFAIWSNAQPVIVGRQMFLIAQSGWIFNLPVDHVMSNPGHLTDPGFMQPIAKRLPTRYQPQHLPSDQLAAQLPTAWTAYAGGPTLNALRPFGPSGISWSTQLAGGLNLSDPPKDESLYGTALATHMTHLAFGVGTGVTPALGMVFAGSNQQTLNALNAETGEIIWTYKTANSTHAQPLVTPQAVIAASGDQYFNLPATERFSIQASNTQVFSNFGHVSSIDPFTGREQWTVFTGAGTSAMTPLYHDKNLYWVGGNGRIWAIDAATGTPIAKFMNKDFQSNIKLGGFNVLSSANVLDRSAGGDIMIVGTAMPNQVLGINLETATIAWQQNLTPFKTYVTGFAGAPLAVDPLRRLALGSVFVDEDPLTKTVTVLVYALDAVTGAVVWAQPIGSGETPIGFSAPTPMLDANNIYVNNPLTNTVVCLSIPTGELHWQTAVATTPGRPSWGPGVITGTKLIQASGSELITIDTISGNILNIFPVGGAFTYNNPVLVGKTLYIGNSWGWVFAFPLGQVTADPADN